MARMSKRLAPSTKRRKTRSAQRGGAQTIIADGGVNYQGADVLLLNNYHGTPTIVVFRSTLTAGPLPAFGLAGGRCEVKHHGLIENTITEELYEESRKSVFIDHEVFMLMTNDDKYVDIAPGPIFVGGPDQMRRAYVCAGNFSTTIYNENKSIFDRLIAQDPANKARYHSYLETSEMFRIPIADMEAAIVRLPARGKPMRVNGRDIYVQQGVFNAYIAAKAKNLIANPFDLLAAPIKWSEPANGLTVRDRRGLTTGRVDSYYL